MRMRGLTAMRKLWVRQSDGDHSAALGFGDEEIKNEDEICTSSLSSSTIPLTSGIEEAPQLLLSVDIFLP